MSNRKNHNSIVFLTTLGVYLGLVLVGAAIPVAAQQPVAACDERELRQEAEKKFSEIGLVNDYVYVLPRLSRILLNDGYVIIGNFKGFEIDIVLLESAKNRQPEFKINLGNIASRNNISYTEDLLRYVGSVADAAGRSGCALDNFGCSPFELKLRFDDQEFFAELKYNRKSSRDAKKFADAYRASIEVDACLYAAEPLLKFRFENTKVTVKKNQVLIVTRLPRASIDKLLAKNAQ